MPRKELTPEQKSRDLARLTAWAKAHPDLVRKRNREALAAKRAADPNYGKEAQRRYRENNREKVREYQRLWREKNRDYPAKWRAANPGYETAYEKRRGAVDFDYKFMRNLRKRMYMAVRGLVRSGESVRLLGCTVAEARAHVEKQWLHGMTWETYGPEGWHIDHIRPLASFDLNDPEQRARACHYTNLQPLWAFHNRSKGKKTA